MFFSGDGSREAVPFFSRASVLVASTRERDARSMPRRDALVTRNERHASQNVHAAPAERRASCVRR